MIINDHDTVDVSVLLDTNVLIGHVAACSGGGVLPSSPASPSSSTDTHGYPSNGSLPWCWGDTNAFSASSFSSSASSFGEPPLAAAARGYAFVAPGVSCSAPVIVAAGQGVEPSFITFQQAGVMVQPRSAGASAIPLIIRRLPSTTSDPSSHGSPHRDPSSSVSSADVSGGEWVAGQALPISPTPSPSPPPVPAADASMVARLLESLQRTTDTLRE